MSTALTDASNSAVSQFDGDPFSAGTDNLPGTTTFMKFTGNSGNFTAGQDDDDIPHGTRFAADMFNSAWVWSFWWDAKPLDSFNDLLRENPLSYDNEPTELPDDPDGVIDMTMDEIKQARKEDNQFREGWSVQATVNLRPMDGSDEEYSIRLGGSVAMRAFHGLRKSYGRLFKIKAGMIPIIEVGADKYKSKIKGVGTRYAPTLKIVDWKTEEELAGLGGVNEEDYDDVVDNADLPTSEVADEAPAPRGRRGARGLNTG